MGSSSVGFTGSSQFSTDFANVVQRAVDIASLPINQLKTDAANYQSQSDQLTQINGVFANLQSAVQGITDAMGGSAYDATVSDTSAVNVSLADGAMEGNYSVDVQQVGTSASSISSQAWVGASGTAHTYQLWIGDKSDPRNEIDITPANNSVAAVAQAINLRAGDKVHATVVNNGANDSRISLQATALGPNTLDLVDPAASATGLQKTLATGALAKYVVDGITQPDGSAFTSTSNTLTIGPGITVKLLTATSANAPINITVSRSTSALSNALTAFASAYNDAVDALDAQRGSTPGALGGQPVTYDLRQALSSMATYSLPGSAISGLKALGLDLGTNGKLEFNSMALMATDITNSAGISAFLGSAGSASAPGSGFLKVATEAMDHVENSTSGIIKAAQANYQAQVTSANALMSDKQTKVDQLQQRLLEQMAAADALISSMEQQYSYLSNMFSAMQTADQQYK